MIKQVVLSAALVISMIGMSYAAPHHNNNSNSNASARAGAIAVGVGVSRASNDVDITNRNKNNNSNSNYNSANQGQMQGQLQGQSTNNANNSSLSVNVEGDTNTYEAKDIPVSSAVGGHTGAAGGGSFQCLVPMSGGVQGMSFGVSLGSAARDKDCVIFQLANMETDAKVKLNLLCLIPEYVEAQPLCEKEEVEQVATRYVKDTQGRDTNVQLTD